MFIAIPLNNCQPFELGFFFFWVKETWQHHWLLALLGVAYILHILTCLPWAYSSYFCVFIISCSCWKCHASLNLNGHLQACQSHLPHIYWVIQSNSESCFHDSTFYELKSIYFVLSELWKIGVVPFFWVICWAKQISRRREDRREWGWGPLTIILIPPL